MKRDYRMKNKRTKTIVIVVAILLAISYFTILEESEDVNVGESESSIGYDVSETEYIDKYKDTYSDPFWDTVFTFPTDEEVEKYENGNQKRSPYISGYFQIPDDTKFTEYMIDFRADYVPNGTYISLANWKMDRSALEEQYESINASHIDAYAGFQKLSDGRMYSIMSFWDVFCKDKDGKEVEIRAKRVFPETTASKEAFDGEGTGAHHSDAYAWESDHWYRMYLKCSTSRETGNTLVEQGVLDLETGLYTTLCIYDIGYPNSTFVGTVAVFLENYDADYAGHVRTMEFCNAKIFNATTNQWNDLKDIHIYSMQPQAEQTLLYSGSYNFGVTEDRFWIITSGVGGDWHNNGKGKRDELLSVK